MKFLSFALSAASLVAAAEFRVIVGRDDGGNVANVFTPNQVQAAVGDVVHFEFRAKNHTVTQSSFAEPCTQQFNTATQLRGVDSGFQPFVEGAGSVPVYSVEVVQANTPIWMFCARAPHCNAGMVFAINAPTSGERTFEAFSAKASTANHPEYGTTADFTPPNAGTTPPAGQTPVTPPGGDSTTNPGTPNPAAPNTPTTPSAGGNVPVVSVLTPTPSSIPAAADGAQSATSGAISSRSVSTGVAISLVGIVAAAFL